MLNNYVLRQAPLLLHDGLESERDVEALAASGDCFITLATQADELVQLADMPIAARTRLEAMTRAMIYLQRHYTLVKKTADYHQ